MSRPSWDQYALALAEAAAIRSVDEYRKVGAVVLRADNSVAGVGYNGPPAGVDVDQLDKEYRKAFAVHAEVNALRWSTPKETRGGLIAVTLSPCLDCLKAIAAAGISRVVYPALSPKQPDDQRLEVARTCGIELLPTVLPLW